MAQPDTPSPDDGAARGNRRHLRRRALKAARLVINEKFSSFDVLIRDISDGGVRLKLNTLFVVPGRFELVILNPNTGVVQRRHCETRWQHGDQVGAKFCTEDTASGPKAA